MKRNRYHRSYLRMDKSVYALWCHSILQHRHAIHPSNPTLCHTTWDPNHWRLQSPRQSSPHPFADQLGLVPPIADSLSDCLNRKTCNWGLYNKEHTFSVLSGSRLYPMGGIHHYGCHGMFRTSLLAQFGCKYHLFHHLL